MCGVASIEPAGTVAPRGAFRMTVVRTALALAVPGLAAAVRLPAPAVEEGLGVRQLRFTGNHSFESFVLAAAIATTNSSWFARFGGVRWLGLGEKRRLNEREFRRDVPRLLAFFRLHGYLEAQVDPSVVRTESDAYITFHIREGPPILVEHFEIKGLDSLPQRADLVQDLPLRLRRPYDRPLRRRPGPRPAPHPGHRGAASPGPGLGRLRHLRLLPHGRRLDGAQRSRARADLRRLGPALEARRGRALRAGAGEARPLLGAGGRFGRVEAGQLQCDRIVPAAGVRLARQRADQIGRASWRERV